MKLNQIIQDKRKLGYTQGQIANYLGVSTPAVNKWEKGISSPDIVLLAPLARLLKTDINTLLCYQEELTQNEIMMFCKELREVYRTDGFDNAYENVQEKLKQYPNNMKLIHDMAVMLHGFLILEGISKEKKKLKQEMVFNLYEQLLNSQDSEEKNSAAFMLSSKYIAMGEFEKAQKMIDILPTFNAMNKRLLQANLYVAEGKYVEEIEIHENILIMDVLNVWNHLLSLQGIKVKQKLFIEAEQIANICSMYAATMELPDYYRIIPLFQQAVTEKDIDKSINLLKQLIPATKKISLQIRSDNSVLYQNCGFKSKGSRNEVVDIMPAILQEINDCEEYGFLKESLEYQKIISSVV